MINSIIQNMKSDRFKTTFPKIFFKYYRRLKKYIYWYETKWGSYGFYSYIDDCVAR